MNNVQERRSVLQPAGRPHLRQQVYLQTARGRRSFWDTRTGRPSPDVRIRELTLTSFGFGLPKFCTLRHLCVACRSVMHVGLEDRMFPNFTVSQRKINDCSGFDQLPALTHGILTEKQT
jgi:hypothetical protein